MERPRIPVENVVGVGFLVTGIGLSALGEQENRAIRSELARSEDFRNVLALEEARYQILLAQRDLWYQPETFHCRGIPLFRRTFRREPEQFPDGERVNARLEAATELLSGYPEIQRRVQAVDQALPDRPEVRIVAERSVRRDEVLARYREELNQTYYPIQRDIYQLKSRLPEWTMTRRMLVPLERGLGMALMVVGGIATFVQSIRFSWREMTKER